MANQIELLALNINTEALTKKLSELKGSIDQLQASQKQLTKEGQTSSSQFIQQAATLKTLSSQYSSQLNVLSSLNAAKQNSVNVADSLNQALMDEVQSVQQATDNNKILLSVRNQLDASTEEGAKAIQLLNQKIDENTEFIKENVSAGEQQKMSIGGYKDQIIEAANALNPLNGGMQGFSQRAAEAGGAGNLLTTSFKGMAAGIGGMTKAGLAFIATPLGAAIAALGVIIAGIVGTFKFVIGAMSSTEEGSNKLARVTATVSGAFNGLYKLIKPLGEFIGNQFVKYFDLAVAAVDKTVQVVSKGLKFLGFDGAAESVQNFSNAMAQGSKDAVALANAEAKLTEAQRQSERIQLDYQKRAEKLRQVRDDESKSIQERTRANEQLGGVLKQQLNAELAIANQALLVANLRMKSEGRSKEVLDAQAEALTKISDINERITGQESEQLANLNSLRKEAADAEKERQSKIAEARQKAVDAAIQQNKDEIDLYVQSQGTKKKSMADELAFEEELSKKRLAVLEKEFKAGKMSKTKYEADKLTISNEFAQKQVDATISNAQTELDQFKQSITKRKQEEGFYSAERLNDKVEENNLLAEKELEFQALRLEQGVINQQEYNATVNRINEENRIANEEATAEREEAQKEKELEDFENKLAIAEEQNTVTMELLLQDLENQRVAEIAAAEKSGADVSLINAKYAEKEKAIRRSVESAKLDQVMNYVGQAKGLFKEHTLAYKAAAIAEIAVTTAKNAMSAYDAAFKPVATVASPALGAVYAGITIALGAAQAAKVAGIKFQRGGLAKGKSHAEGGIPFTVAGQGGFEMEGGEAIINKKSTARYRNLLSAINVDGGGVAFGSGGHIPLLSSGNFQFANGGVTGNFSMGSLGGTKIDTEGLAVKIGQEVGSQVLAGINQMPAPQVEVTEITSAQQSRAKAQVKASH